MLAVRLRPKEPALALGAVIRITGIVISVMRTAAPAYLPLFRSELQLRLLGLLLLAPTRTWTADQLAHTLEAPAASVHRELHRALDAGLVERDASQRPHRYEGSVDSPLHDALRELLARTVGLEEELRHLLDQDAGVEAAVIHGSWAAGRIRPDSDLDVLVVGDADLSALRRAALKVGRRAGRQVDITLLRPDEFRSGVKQENGFLAKIVDGPTKPLVGELQALL